MEANRTESFTVNEAAAIAEISPGSIRTALEKKSVVPSHQRKTRRAVRHGFSANDVLFIKVLAEFPFALSKQDKSSLAEVLARGHRHAAHWSLRGTDLLYRSGEMQLRIQYRRLQQRVCANLAAYRWGKRRIVSSPDILSGEPVFRGTRVPVQHVAALFRKAVPPHEIAEEFPALSPRDLAYARLLSRLGEKPGRPKKRLLIHREDAAA